MKFMNDRHDAPIPDFLEIMVAICKSLSTNEILQTKLFVRICALHRCETLDIPMILLKNAFSELADGTSDPNAAFGILKLAYENHLPFIDFPRDALTSF